MKVKGDVDILMRKHLERMTRDFYSEIRFAPPRKWRFDWAVFSFVFDEKSKLRTPVRLAIEIEGGAWTRGRHTRAAGFIRDMEKYNKAACLGWSILRFTPDQIRRGEDIPVIREWLNNRA